ncbi:unnamed protein product, partial [marine sediment metagenome]
GTVVYGLSKEDVVRTVEEYEPDIVGLSWIFTTLDGVLQPLAESIKAASPHTALVFGGTHATVMAEQLVREPFVDYVIRGEGDYAFLRLVEYLEQKRPIEEVNNLTWLENGRVRSTPQEFIQDLDELPLPARHLLDMEGYLRIGRMQGLFKKGARATTLITSRGCPARCVFCSIHSVWGRRFRAHSTERVLEEMHELHDKYGIRHLLFEDDNLTFDRKRAEAIFQGMIEREFRFSWTTPNGVAMWRLDDHLLELMRDSGCYWLSLGLESGDPETLSKVIRKPLRFDRVEGITRACKRLGIRTTALFVLGLPGETLESMRRSMKYAEDMDVDSIAISVATPYPGTPLYKICEENGYLVEDFQMGKLMTRIGQIRTPEFGPEDIQNLVNRTLLRRALKHPAGTLRRIFDKFRASPATTLGFVVKRAASGILNRSPSRGCN